MEELLLRIPQKYYKQKKVLDQGAESEKVKKIVGQFGIFQGNK